MRAQSRGTVTQATVRVLGLDDAAAWQQTLARFGFVDPYFTLGYARLWTTIEGGSPHLFVYEDASGGFAYPFRQRAVAEIRGLEQFTSSWDIVSDYGYGGPVARIEAGADGPAFVGRAVAAFDATCAERGIVAEFCRFHPLLENAELVRKSHQPVLCNQTAWVDLRISGAEIWQQVRKGHRYDIRKAERNGIEVRTSESPDDAAECYRLYAESMDAAGAKPYYYFGAEFFAETLCLLTGNVIMFFAAHAGQTIAASMFLFGDKLCHYHFSGLDRRFASITPNKLLMFRAIEWAKAKGFERLHLGGGFGGSDSDSLMLFKAGFTRLRASFHITKRVHDPAAYARLCDAVGVAPTVDGFFPAYRAVVSSRPTPRGAEVRE